LLGYISPEFGLRICSKEQKNTKKTVVAGVKLDAATTAVPVWPQWLALFGHSIIIDLWQRIEGQKEKR
jgi:hypothetical protein